MDSYSLTWAVDGEVDLLKGGDNAGLLVSDHTILNDIAKPANLQFYASPVFRLPLAFREFPGQWSEARAIKLQVEEKEDKPSVAYAYHLYGKPNKEHNDMHKTFEDALEDPDKDDFYDAESELNEIEDEWDDFSEQSK